MLSFVFNSLLQAYVRVGCVLISENIADFVSVLIDNCFNKEVCRIAFRAYTMREKLEREESTYTHSFILNHIIFIYHNVFQRV